MNLVARPNVTAYASAKTGVVLQTRAIAKAEAGRGITANVVAPGVIENSLIQPVGEIPSGRVGRVDEVAAAVLYLVSPAEEYLDRGPRVDGVELASVYEAFPTMAFNLCSRCPVFAVPSGFARNGVPTGISIVGRTYDDVGVFRAAGALERTRPWLDAPERRPPNLSARLRRRGAAVAGRSSKPLPRRVAEASRRSIASRSRVLPALSAHRATEPSPEGT
jgi:hypothetical protein